MLFNSEGYGILLALALLAYWSTKSVPLRQVIVFIASVVFYIQWSFLFVFLLLGLIILNWVITVGVYPRNSRLGLWLVVLANLGILFSFKYLSFFVDNVVDGLQLIGIAVESPRIPALLPLGISFYVFELISYAVDLYNKKMVAERNPLKLSIFVLFFPHLIAGPICRANQFMPQIGTLQKLSSDLIVTGAYLFVTGFALKCGIADGIAPYVNTTFANPDNYGGLDNLLAVVGFGVQIFCDFWGYSLMALGAAKLFGYDLPSNFNSPYTARSIQQFWRRWHITLSNWLRDYLYIPLGGSRDLSNFKITRNLMITMLLGGLWHGASYNFVIWGGIHGLALSVNRYYHLVRLPSGVKAVFSWGPMSWILTMAVVFFSWIFFRAPTLSEALMVVSNIFRFGAGYMQTRLDGVFFELLVMFVILYFIANKTTNSQPITHYSTRNQLLLFSTMFVFSLIYYVDGAQFIYFQF
ncbi:MBOAT family O-acyltransferase [Rhizobium leguminosarum]|uniref:MBOAT family O-acyltransferase n=1 Tax=Rhizobium leguminosarum TaxID=384 RepID=UPI00103927A1|nr:MBOAT family O-acyltransferase [Rhizobium leguminosarum]TBZ80369.1 MBOAT family protein [Rhizobium leguminosarum bv. viciae]TBZ88083.1 MBOAT family protein [Rhizobium leguminosarum bv. viciae]